MQLAALVSALGLLGPWACSSGGATGAGSATGGQASTTTATSSSSSTGPTSTSATAASSSSGAAPPSKVADACASDADCGPNLGCVLPTAHDSIFGGGAPAGYCTTSCASNADCPADSRCLTGSLGVGNCVLTCGFGPKLNQFDDALSASKCRGRDDVRCTLVGSLHCCLPTCSADSQCPAGLACDPHVAECAAPGPAPDAGGGSGTGAPCDPKAPKSVCAGVCLSFTGSMATTCSEVCVLGGDPAHPASSPSCGGVTQGLCIYRPSGNGAGDYGFCAPACLKQDDCQNPDFWCLPVAGLTGTMGVPNGFCTLGTPCPNGASDCASIAMSTCTATNYGPICLTSDFPLGGAAPMDGGTEGGVDDGGTEGGVDDGGTDGGVDDGGNDGGTSDGGDGG